MTAGPKNNLVQQRKLELLEEQQLPTIETLREWRMPPDAREFARRHQVWELLQWYEHAVARPNRGIRGVLRRLWNRIRGRKVKNLSVWEQLRIRDEYEALQRARGEVDERGDGEGPSLVTE